MAAVFTHPACVRHDPGPGHPETPARLATLLARLASTSGIALHEATPTDVNILETVHPREYLTALEAQIARGGGPLSEDTVTNAASWDAVLGAVGALNAGIDHARAGRGHAFAAVRPPGHHALASTAMGFCLVNHVVVGARYALAGGAKRVLIIDWDVHHGNGTQALVEHDPAIRYVSLHQHPWYPGTGLEHERGVGNVFNVPRGPGRVPGFYVEALWEAIVAATTGWQPDLVLLSAGFDAMLGDPLGGFTLEPEHYAEWTRRLRERLNDRPIVGLLEGGYIPARLAAGVVAHLGTLD